MIVLTQIVDYIPRDTINFLLKGISHYYESGLFKDKWYIFIFWQCFLYIKMV